MRSQAGVHQFQKNNMVEREPECGGVDYRQQLGLCAAAHLQQEGLRVHTDSPHRV